MARTVEAILKANTAGFNSSVDQAAAKMGQLGQKATAAGAQVDAGLKKASTSANRMGSATQKAGLTAAVGLGRASDASEKFGRSGAGILKNSEQLNSLSRTAGLAGAAVFAGIGLAVKATADFDVAMSGVAATGEEFKGRLDELRDSAIKAGAATSFSATEAANAQEELAKAGVNAQDVLEGGLTGALDLAAAGSLGVADAANIAATAMTQFGLTGAEVPHIADLLAAGAGKAQGSVQDLGLALNYVGPVAKSMGISIEETTGALALFASAGIVGEKGGTALRGVLLSLTSPSKAAADTMKQYGISLYDAQDRFIGLDGVAQELKNGLGDVSEAQRNAALGTIFGNAQITAATVLMKDGASAVNDWTAKVNDSGFAARTAATKMDNLRGDVEKLGGSLQTALIQSGEGATGGLRGIAQAADSAVSAFNNLSPATKSAGLAVAAIGGAGLLSVAGIAKLAVGAAEARAAMSALKTDSPRLAGALGGIGKAAGVAAGALIALEVAGAAAKAFHGVLIPDIKAADAALKSLAATGNAVNLDKLFNIQSKSFGQTITEVDSLGSAFQALGRENWADRLNGQIDSMLGTTETSFTRLRVQFDGLDQSLIGLSASGHADQAAAAFKKIADQAALQGYPVEKLIQLFPQYAQSVQAAATASGKANLAGQELADAMGGQLSPSLEKALKSAGALPQSFSTAANAAASFGTAIESIVRPTALTLEQTQQLSGQLFQSGNAFQNASSTHAAYAASLDSADKALGKHSLSINKDTGFLADNTQKQRDAGAALNDIAASGKAYVQSLVAQGGSAKEAAAATANVRKEFVSAADAAGLSAGQASKLADSYGLIPKEVSTTFQAFGLALQEQQVKDYGDRILKLPKEQQSKILAIYNDKGAKAALTELNKLEKKNAKPKVTVDGKQAVGTARAIERGIGKIPDKKPKVTINPSQATGAAKSIGRRIGDIPDKKPKVTINTGPATAAAKSIGRRIGDIPDGKPKVTVQADTSGASAAQRAINGVRGKTVTVTVKRINSGNMSRVATGGFITEAGVLRRAPGGPVWGAGTATSDSIPAMLSNGEFVQRAAAVDKYGVAFMEAINGLRVDPSTLPAFRDGGPVQKFAVGGQPQREFFGNPAYNAPLAVINNIVTRMKALENPLFNVAKAAAAVARSQHALDVENRKIARPKATMDRANARYKDAIDDRDAQKARLVELKKRADATKGITAADKAYRRAQQELARINIRVTKTSKERTAATAAYNKVAERSKSAADKLKQAQDALAASQQALADNIRQISATLRESAATTSTDPADVLAKRKETAAALEAFNKQLLALRKAGLNDQDITDIMNRGALDGSDLAGQILKGGKKMVDALNAAQAQLTAAADKVGTTVSVGVIRRAGGGWVDRGPYGVDKVPALLTRGEFVVEPKAAAANAQFLEAMNRSRGLVRGSQGSTTNIRHGDVSRSISIPIKVEHMGVTESQVLSKIQGRFMDSLVMTGLAGVGV